MLQRRFDTARLHYDIQRRSVDRSFSETLTRLPLDRALDLYAQVLLKIESHYVDSPNWKELVERGTNNLEIALSEPVFLERYVPEANRPAARGFSQRVEVDARRPADPHSRRRRPGRGRRRRVGPKAAGHSAHRRGAGISLRGYQLPGPILRFPHARSIK